MMDVAEHQQDEIVRRKMLARALDAVSADADVIVGPWTGEVGFELLYWIPFLNWLSEQGPGGRRMVVVTRGGAAAWYRHLTTRGVEILDLVSPDEFRERTAGKKKQSHQQNEFDAELIQLARQRLGMAGDGPWVHPATMFRVFTALWRHRAGVELVDAFSSFRALTPPPPAARPAGLPRDYVVAKFYFSKAFPDTANNRAFVGETLRAISRHVPVALLSTSVRLDEHVDYQTASASGLFIVDTHSTPQQNLQRQTELIAGARGFAGTYGGFSYLAPFYGVPSLSFYSREGFETHHLDVANRVFDRMCPGGFLAIDRRDTGLETIVSRWVERAAALEPVNGAVPHLESGKAARA